MRIILASASPRRRELLEMLHVPAEIIPSAGEERCPPGLSPEETVQTLSRQKAREVAARVGDAEAVVIGADTVVALDGRIMGKPRDAADAGRMLQSLSGRTHRVYTGVTVLRGDREAGCVEETAVTFRTLSPGEIDRYISTGEPMDKAGAYAAQGLASLFVERLEGDFFNVVGLPLCALGKLLKQTGIELL